MNALLLIDHPSRPELTLLYTVELTERNIDAPEFVSFDGEVTPDLAKSIASRSSLPVIVNRYDALAALAASK